MSGADVIVIGGGHRDVACPDINWTDLDFSELAIAPFRIDRFAR